MRAVAALSEHPLATHAVGECVGRLLELGGERPDLVAVWATPPHGGALEDVVSATRRLLDPMVLVGCAAESVMGGGREVEAHAALSLLALWDLGEVEPLRWGRGDGTAVEHLAGAQGTAWILADPFDLDIAGVLSELAVRAPGLTVVGGVASAGRHPGGNRLLLDGAEYRDGAVGVYFGPRVPVRPCLSQGTRPIGDPLTVTAAADRSLLELAGRPAMEVLRSVVDALGPEDQLLAANSVELGLVDDPGRSPATWGPGESGDEQVRVVAVHGVDRSNGALGLGGPVDVGATAQFHLRDPLGAELDLCDLLRGEDGSAAALVCTSTSRGAGYFGVPDRQSALLADLMPRAAVAGMSSLQEFGPVGGVPGVRHGTTTLLVFG